MDKNWEDFFEELIDEAGMLIKDEVRIMLDSAKNDSEVFVKRQAEKAEKYLNQFASGKINKKQLEGYLRDIQALTEMFALQLSMASRVRVQRLTEGITALIIDKLLALI